MLMGATFVIFTITLGQAQGVGGAAAAADPRRSAPSSRRSSSILAVLPATRVQAPAARLNILFFGSFDAAQRGGVHRPRDRRVCAVEDGIYRTMARDIYQNGVVLAAQEIPAARLCLSHLPGRPGRSASSPSSCPISSTCRSSLEPALRSDTSRRSPSARSACRTCGCHSSRGRTLLGGDHPVGMAEIARPGRGSAWPCRGGPAGRARDAPCMHRRAASASVAARLPKTRPRVRAKWRCSQPSSRAVVGLVGLGRSCRARRARPGSAGTDPRHG